MYILTEENRDSIIEAAYAKHRKYSNTIRGQTITEKDDLSYWVILETLNFVEDDLNILSYQIE